MSESLIDAQALISRWVGDFIDHEDAGRDAALSIISVSETPSRQAIAGVFEKAATRVRRALVAKSSEEAEDECCMSTRHQYLAFVVVKYFSIVWYTDLANFVTDARDYTMETHREIQQLPGQTHTVSVLRRLSFLTDDA
ncbi:hypothetical protein ACFL2H_07020 [Planctomycetota bacterium]